mmetsp:Transcript_74606/g.228293  ORF Transcript_74606/g.228293 Transcript_74606/m.228293 type:complete len:207 (+) Transcript_74606:1319-1939(+)
MALLMLVPPPWCSWCNRSTSSCRLSWMPTLAPSSRIIVGTLPSADGSSGPSSDSALAMLLRYSCRMMAAESKRCAASLWSMPRMYPLHVWSHFGARIFTSFLRMSFSSRNGNLPVTKPYMSTPCAQMSTDSPYNLSRSSGAQNCRVPTCAVKRSCGSKYDAVPKSARTILHCGSRSVSRSIMQLSPLMSRWPIDFSCRWAMAAAIW